MLVVLGHTDLVNTLVNHCELNLPSVYLLGLHDRLDLRTSLQRIKIYSNVSVLSTKMSGTLVFSIVGSYFLESFATTQL